MQSSKTSEGLVGVVLALMVFMVSVAGIGLAVIGSLSTALWSIGALMAVGGLLFSAPALLRGSTSQLVTGAVVSVVGMALAWFGGTL